MQCFIQTVGVDPLLRHKYVKLYLDVGKKTYLRNHKTLLCMFYDMAHNNYLGATAIYYDGNEIQIA